MVDSFAPLFTWETDIGEFGVVILSGNREGKPYCTGYVSRYVEGSRLAFATVDLSPGSIYGDFDEWRYKATSWKPDGDTPAREKYPVADCGHRHIPHTGPMGTMLPTDADGRTLCLPCADDRMRAAMASAQPGERTDAYLSEGNDERGRVTTSHGGLLGFAKQFNAATLRTPSGAPYTRRYYEVRDVFGGKWVAHGSGAAMALTLMRLKEKTAA